MTPEMQAAREREQRALDALSKRLNKGVALSDPKVPVLKLAQAWNNASVARKALELSEMLSVAAGNCR